MYVSGLSWSAEVNPVSSFVICSMNVQLRNQQQLYNVVSSTCKWTLNQDLVESTPQRLKTGLRGIPVFVWCFLIKWLVKMHKRNGTLVIYFVDILSALPIRGCHMDPILIIYARSPSRCSPHILIQAWDWS